MGFNTPKTGSASNFKIPIRLKDGTTVVRFIPPVDKFDPSNESWAEFHRQHFGYKTSDRKIPGKTKMFTFKCVLKQDWRTKAIQQFCPECAKIEEQKELFADRSAVMRSQGKSDQDIEDQLSPLKKWIEAHNVDGKWHSMILTADGKLEVLAYTNKTKKAIEKAVAKEKEEVARTKGEAFAADWNWMDPDGGILLALVRSGKGIATEYDAEIVKENSQVALANGQMVSISQTKTSPLTVSHRALIEREAINLKDIGRTITVDQISRLVASSGDPQEIDAIVDAPQAREKSAPRNRPTPVADVVEPEPEDIPESNWSSTPTAPPFVAAPVTPVAPVLWSAPPTPTVSVEPALIHPDKFRAMAAAPVQAAVVPTVAPAVVDVAAMMAQMAAMQAMIDAQKAAASKPAPATAGVGTDAGFLNMFRPPT